MIRTNGNDHTEEEKRRCGAAQARAEAAPSPGDYQLALPTHAPYCVLVTRSPALLCVALALTACVHGGAPAPAPVETRPLPSPAPSVAPTVPNAAGASQPGAERPTNVAAVHDSSTVDTVTVSKLDIQRGAVAVFGDSVAPPLPVDPAGPSWDIDVRSYETQAKVQHFVDLFSGPARERIADRLARGSRYEAMIRTRFHEGGLPEDLYYLALIESGFDPNAYSKAAAVGMWQFMTSTARDMGMRVDWWIDERRDPVRSTTAAVRFIKGLQQQFGSLYLAAAAYNGGPGRISRGLTRYADDLQDAQGEDVYFALAEKDFLRSETKDYVPQLIAIALVAKDPRRYGMDLRVQAPFTYDSVQVGPRTSLAAIAKASGATVPELQELNPHILRGMTPPRDSIVVRIPATSRSQFESAFAALDSSERVGATTVKSKEGQYLETIAKKSGLTTRQLASYNPKLEHTKSGRLVPGQAVIVPSAAVANAAVNVPDPAIERFPSSAGKAGATHVVRSGETLGGIAKRYGMTTKRLMELNGLRRELIFPGQSLIVSSKPATAAKPKSQPAKAKAAPG
jgi:membrane-bound lytic murein transglycosylase D